MSIKRPGVRGVSGVSWQVHILMPKRVAKSEAILALLDTFQGCISNGGPE